MITEKRRESKRETHGRESQTGREREKKREG